MILSLSLQMLVFFFLNLSYFVLLKKCKDPRLKNKDLFFVTSDIPVKCQHTHPLVEGNHVMIYHNHKHSVHLMSLSKQCRNYSGGNMALYDQRSVHVIINCLIILILMNCVCKFQKTIYIKLLVIMNYSKSLLPECPSK